MIKLKKKSMCRYSIVGCSNTQGNRGLPPCTASFLSNSGTGSSFRVCCSSCFRLAFIIVCRCVITGELLLYLILKMTVVYTKIYLWSFVRVQPKEIWFSHTIPEKVRRINVTGEYLLNAHSVLKYGI